MRPENALDRIHRVKTSIKDASPSMNGGASFVIRSQTIIYPAYF